jgi:hypothetical protein
MARLKRFKAFKPTTMKSEPVSNTKGVRQIIGKLKNPNKENYEDANYRYTYAYAFDRDIYTPAQAKEWLKNREGEDAYNFVAVTMI